MAPAVPRKGAAPDEMAATVAKLAELQEKLLKNSDWVGSDFPETARAMYLGEIASRPVHGQATVDEARSLAEEGVPILPLPLPVVPPGQVN